MPTIISTWLLSRSMYRNIFVSKISLLDQSMQPQTDPQNSSSFSLCRCDSLLQNNLSKGKTTICCWVWLQTVGSILTRSLRLSWQHVDWVLNVRLSSKLWHILREAVRCLPFNRYWSVTGRPFCWQCPDSNRCRAVSDWRPLLSGADGGPALSIGRPAEVTTLGGRQQPVTAPPVQSPALYNRTELFTFHSRRRVVRRPRLLGNSGSGRELSGAKMDSQRGEAHLSLFRWTATDAGGNGDNQSRDNCGVKVNSYHDICEWNK